MLTNANAALGASVPNASEFTPCPPTVTVVDAAAFPPCFSFVGSTGAHRYEVWVKPGDAGEDVEFFRAAADATDTVAFQVLHLGYATSRPSSVETSTSCHARVSSSRRRLY